MTSFADPGSGQRNANVVLSTDVSGYQRGMATADQQTRGLIGTVDALIGKLGQLKQSTENALGRSSRDISLGLGSAAADAVLFQKQLSTLNATAAITNQSMAGIKKSIDNTFTSLPVSRTSIVALTEALEDLGVTGTNELTKLTKTYEKLGAATGEGPIELAQAMQQLNRTFGGVGADQAGKYANALLTVSKDAGVAALGVASFAQEIGPLAKQAGLGEAAVLGISAAFNRAGQDGRVAANAFNSILYDITRLIQTGSPELAKYGALIGTTADQFRKLPPEQQISRIFTALGTQGPRAARTLESWGMEGVRTQAAIAGIVQSGNLNKYINEAVGASGDTKNLDKGAHAALSGITDDLALLRNQFTAAGSAIGSTFLPPLHAGLQGVDALAGGVRSLVQTFAPLIAVAGLGGAAVAGVGGLALHAAGVVGAIALGRYALRSTGAASFGLGRAMQRGVAEEDMTASQRRAAAAYNAGTMNRMQMFAMNRGIQSQELQERLIGPNATAALTPGQMLRMGLIAPGRTAAYLFRDSRNFLNESMRNDFERRGLQWGEGGGMRQVWANLRASGQRGFGAVPGAYGDAARAGIGYYGAVARTGFQMIGRGTGALFSGLSGGIHPIDQAQAAYARSMLQSAEMLGVTSKAELGFTASLRAATAGATEFTGALVKGAAMAGLRGGVGLVGAGVGAAGSALGAIGRAVFSLPGMIALTAGTAIYSHAQDRAQAVAAREGEDTYLQPIKAYNDQLGIATAKLGAFGDALASATSTPGLGTVTANTPMSAVATVTSEDRLSAPSIKVTDKKIQALRKVGGGASQLAALAQSYDFTDPRAVQLFKMQALSAGFSSTDVGMALQSLPSNLGRVSTAEPDLAAIGTRVWQHQAQTSGWASFVPAGLRAGFGLGPHTASQSSGELQSAAIGGIQARAEGLASTRGAPYAAQRTLAYGLRFLGQTYKSLDDSSGQLWERNGADIRRSELAKGLKQLLNLKGSAGDIEDALSDYNFSSMSANKRQSTLIKVAKRFGGGDSLKALEQAGGTLDPAKFTQALHDLAMQGAYNGTTAQLRNLGPLGRYATVEGGTVQKGLLNPENTTKYYAALDGLTDRAIKTGDGLTGASRELGRLQQEAGGTTTELYKLAAAAQGVVAAEQAYRMPTLSRAGQFGAAAGNYVAARQLAASPDATDAQKAAVQPGGEARNSWESAVENQRQFLIQSYHMAQEYGVQQRRAYQDYYHSEYIANRDFWISMAENQADFAKSQRRAQQDFNIQMGRMSEQAAQSIYDPFKRVTAQYTADAGTVVQNLEDQNRRIETQRRQLSELHRQGLSTQAIQELDLANPNNAQQTDKLLRTLMNDPKLIAQINQQVSTRVGATTALTQNQFSMTFTHAVEDFQRSSQRAVEDFNTSRDRAVAAHARAMDDMAYQFHQTIRRSQEDLARSMEEITGNFAEMFPRTMKMIDATLAKYAPKAYSIIHAQMSALLAEFEQGLAALQTPDDNRRPGGPTGEHAGPGTTTPYRDPSRGDYGQGGHALGGISLREHVARFSEGNKAELMLPLDQRGQQYMAGMYAAIASSVVRQMPVASRGIPATGTGGSTVTTYDYSTQITGPITVEAADPSEMMRKLDAKKRLDRLARPGRTTANS